MIASAKTSLLIPQDRASPRLLARFSSSPRPGRSASPLPPLLCGHAGAAARPFFFPTAGSCFFPIPTDAAGLFARACTPPAPHPPPSGALHPVSVPPLSLPFPTPGVRALSPPRFPPPPPQLLAAGRYPTPPATAAIGAVDPSPP
uniref:Uncharacterized protein n=1 Tax=Oryza meridionalis TaxID=40149 RepID=A0A0E0EIU5_9ORYZ